MKFTIARNSLSTLLAAAGSVLSTRTTLPILSNVLITAADGKLTVSGTNLDQSRSASAAASIETSGSITLPGKRLMGLINEVVDGNVLIETTEKNKAIVKAGAAQFSLLGLPGEEFPAATEVAGTTFELPQADLKAALDRCLFAVSTDETKFMLNGVCFDFSGDSLTLVATDGRRLSAIAVPLQSDLSGKTYIVPTQAATQIRSMCATTGTIKISLDEKAIKVETDGATLVSKLIEAKFPNYKPVIPAKESCPASIEFATADMIASLERVSVLNPTQAVILNLDKGNISIESVVKEIGEGRETVTAEYDGPANRVAFNPTFLIQALRQVKAEKSTLHLGTTHQSPLLLQEPFTYVAMPCQL